MMAVVPAVTRQINQRCFGIIPPKWKRRSSKHHPWLWNGRFDDIYHTDGFESFICKITAVHAEKSVLHENGKIDYTTLNPVLFEMPAYRDLRTGDVIGNCMKLYK